MEGWSLRTSSESLVSLGWETDRDTDSGFSCQVHKGSKKERKERRRHVLKWEEANRSLIHVLLVLITHNERIHMREKQKDLEMKKCLTNREMYRKNSSFSDDDSNEKQDYKWIKVRQEENKLYQNINNIHLTSWSNKTDIKTGMKTGKKTGMKTRDGNWRSMENKRKTLLIDSFDAWLPSLTVFVMSWLFLLSLLFLDSLRLILSISRHHQQSKQYFAQKIGSYYPPEQLSLGRLQYDFVYYHQLDFDGEISFLVLLIKSSRKWQSL